MVRHAACTLVLLAAAVTTRAQQAPTLALWQGGSISGDGTHYAGTGSYCTLTDWINNPGPGNTPWVSQGGANGNLWPVAIGNYNYNLEQSQACGMCVAITGLPYSSGAGYDPIAFNTIWYGVVIDRCGECAPGDLDFRADNQLSGRFPVKWYPVQCPVAGESLSYDTQGSNMWYIKLQVRNQRVPIQSVAMDLNGDGYYTPLDRTPDNFWEYGVGSTSSKPEGTNTRPLSLKITSIMGDTVYEPNLQVYNHMNTPLPGTVQFPLHTEYRVAESPSNPLATDPSASSLVSVSRPPPTSTPQPSPAPVPTTKPPTKAPTQNAQCAASYTKCGGAGYSGPTNCCDSSMVCRMGSQGNYRCRPPLSTPSATSTPKPTNPPVTQPTQPSGGGGGCSAQWGQCGGIGWSGPKCCATGTTCKYSNDWYSQCV